MVNLNVVTKYNDAGIKKANGGLKALSGSLKSVAGALGFGVGLSAITQGLMDAGRAAAEDAKSQALLATGLRNSVGATQGQIASVERSISAMQLQASVADDQIRPAFDQLARSTGNLEQATRLTNIALDISAATGRDLGAVSIALGKAVQGNVSSLSRLGINAKGVADPIGMLEQRFAGAAEAASRNDPYQRLNIAFGEMQEQVGQALLPELNDLADWLTSPEVIAGIDNLVGGFKDLVEDTALAADGIVYLVDTIAQFVGFDDEVAAQLEDNAFVKFFNSIDNGWFKVSPVLGAIVAALGELGKLGRGPVDPSAGRYKALEDFLKAQRAAGIDFGEIVTEETGTKAKNAIADFYANIQDEIRKQKARLKLEQMGASNALIESIIGAGNDWFKVYKDAIKGGEVGLAALQTKFNQTKAGLAEIAEAEKELADAAAQANAKLAEQTQTFIENQNAQRDAINATLDNVRALGAYRREMGEFETEATDAFASVQESLAEAFKTGAITKAAYDNLVKYASSEASVLINIGKQRDALAAKKSLVESVIADVRDAVIGTAKLGDYVKTEAQTVTETVTRMVGGIAITTSRTTEVLKTNATLVDGFKAVLEKTRAFVGQLRELRKLGLSGDLFKQIVDAGAESGGATAAAIIAGGASTVSELNNLYGEIQTEAGKAAEETAQVLYGSGVNLTNGIIAGIQAQENNLIAVASDLGTKFADAFATKVGQAVADALAIFQNGGIAAPTINAPTIDGNAGGVVFTGVGAVGIGNNSFRAASVNANNQVPVQVNLTLDSKVVAQSLIRLERTSGAIWQRAQ